MKTTIATVLTIAFLTVSNVSRADDIVLMTQQRLYELGWFAGPVDGAMGPKTAAAISNYQRFAGIEETGKPDENWVPMLFIPCQVNLMATGSKARFGCVKPEETDGQMAMVSLEAPPPSYLGRTPCEPEPVENAGPSEVAPLRTDGFYQSAETGFRNFFRFYNDGAVIRGVHYDDPRFMRCLLLREHYETGDSPIERVTVDGNKFEFDYPTKDGVYHYYGTSDGDTLSLGYRLDRAGGGALVDNPRPYSFFADD